MISHSPSAPTLSQLSWNVTHLAFTKVKHKNKNDNDNSYIQNQVVHSGKGRIFDKIIREHNNMLTLITHPPNITDTTKIRSRRGRGKDGVTWSVLTITCLTLGSIIIWFAMITLFSCPSFWAILFKCLFFYFFTVLYYFMIYPNTLGSGTS